MAQGNAPRRALILGAAGRDFHDFNVYFRDNPAFEVVAFTAAQIPYIGHRTYPHALAGGASFHLLGPADTQLASSRPVVAVLGARTGTGKSTITRYLYNAFRDAGRRPVAVRHPMPYGRFDRAVERYAAPEDVSGAPITLEEMEEYQQHVDQGGVVYAGVDYGEVLRAAEAEADLILWDGGNNDMAFFRPDVTVTVADPLRLGQEAAYFPGEANVRAADILVVNKANAADAAAVAATVDALRRLNAGAVILLMDSVEKVDHPERVRGKRVLVVEDGPSVTHGGLPDAVGARAARLLGAEPVDPRPWAVGSIKVAYDRHPQLGCVLPALGYSPEQRRELERSINGVECDGVVLGTPADLARVLRIERPVARVRFEAEDRGGSTLAEAVMARLAGRTTEEPS